MYIIISWLNCFFILQVYMKLCNVIRNFMGVVLLLYGNGVTVSGRPFKNAWMFINTRRKCAASAYKRTVVYKLAAIYKRPDPYPINPFKVEFTIVIFIHYKPRIAVAILDL